MSFWRRLFGRRENRTVTPEDDETRRRIDTALRQSHGANVAIQQDDQDLRGLITQIRLTRMRGERAMRG